MNTPLFVVALIVLLVLYGVYANTRSAIVIFPPQVGLEYRDGKFVQVLPPGRHTRFDPRHRRRIVRLSTAPVAVAMGEVSVISKDQFSFRLGLTPVVAVTDPQRFAEELGLVSEAGNQALTASSFSISSMLQPLVFSAAVAAASQRTMREMLADEAAVSAVIRDRIANALPGIEVKDVLLISITLPPETRKMFTDVERARIEAEAALERSRGEQASLRALANAARLVKDNPALANLRLLQTLESAPGPKTIVIGDVSALPGERTAR